MRNNTIRRQRIMKRVIIGFCIFVLWLAAGSFLMSLTVNDQWNNGYCSCGTHWELKGIGKNNVGYSYKYYSCPNCHNETQTYN